ncbi:hypothetical protein A2264_01895 [candidate division WWE3 bacterium RIFOXYA2_FULL_46_9]|uniref:Uncharacterized protein n=1 Tax=candidate division WWE3 bacterium RIFOXYA2_FULL_46_9 TaxID=1802636 RepID=A0A1F4W0R9_UNCKA|nr:MAG: hypothetical protein A2264_01895 [candidate division WWE3 bacterium RIFOXYA2_FULL_46_9]
MNEDILTRLVVATGCSAGAFGVSHRWWLGAMAGALAWVRPHEGTAAMAIALLIFGTWTALLAGRHRKAKHRIVEDGDIIDADFEVRHG